MRRRRVFRSLIAVLAAAFMSIGLMSGASAHSDSDRWLDQYLPYDAQILLDSPSGYWPQLTPHAFLAADLAGGNHGQIHGSPAVSNLPNGEYALQFDGEQDYLEIPDHPALSTATTGEITIEAWMRPDVLSFENDEKAGYVHWMGKGEPDQHEWVSRMYSLDNTVDRENRISGYQFNIDGGLGAGSYYQEPIEAGEWLHYVLVINSNASVEGFPAGYTKLFINGELVDQDSLIFDGVLMEPERGNAPMRVGTRDFGSFFEGAVGKIAIYDHELSQDRISAHHQSMHRSW